MAKDLFQKNMAACLAKNCLKLLKICILSCKGNEVGGKDMITVRGYCKQTICRKIYIFNGKSFLDKKEKKFKRFRSSGDIRYKSSG